MWGLTGVEYSLCIGVSGVVSGEFEGRIYCEGGDVYAVYVECDKGIR